MDDVEIQKTLEDIDRSAKINFSSSVNTDNGEKSAKNDSIDDEHRILPK